MRFLDNAAFILFAPLFLHFCRNLSRFVINCSTRSVGAAVYLYLPSLLLLAVGTIIFLRDQLVLIAPPLSAVLDYSPSIRRALLSNLFHPFCRRVSDQRGHPDSSFHRQQEHGGAPANEVGRLGIGAGDCALHVALRQSVTCSAPTRPLADRRRVLPLILIPLAFGYSVVRYRLMDVELVVRRVFVYALTTLAIALADRRRSFTSPVCMRLAARSLHSGRDHVAADRLDRADGRDRDDCRAGEELSPGTGRSAVLGERYDMRNSLLDFGRTLSATTALDPLLDSLVSRLQEVMNVERVAIFIEDENATVRLSRGARRGSVGDDESCRLIFAR